MSSTKKVYIFPQSPLRFFALGSIIILAPSCTLKLFLKLCNAQSTFPLCPQGNLNYFKTLETYIKGILDKNNDFFSIAFSVLLSLLIVSAFTKLDSIPEWHKKLLMSTGPVAAAMLVTRFTYCPEPANMALLALIPFIYMIYESTVKSLAWRKDNVKLALERTEDWLAEYKKHEEQIKTLPRRKCRTLGIALFAIAVTPILVIAATRGWRLTLLVFTFTLLAQIVLSAFFWFIPATLLTSTPSHYLWSSTPMCNFLPLKAPGKWRLLLSYFVVEAVSIALTFFLTYNFWIDFCSTSSGVKFCSTNSGVEPYSLIIMMTSTYILTHWSPSHGMSYLWIAKYINRTFRKSEVSRLEKESAKLEAYLKGSK
ncbi:hypothetical protein ACUH95_01650 [Dermabacteraceae bacterium P13101]